MRPEYRSSVAAVLAHRAELQLTEEQAQKLAEIDDHLQTLDASARPESLPADREGEKRRPAHGGAVNSNSGRDSAGEPLPGNQASGEMAGGRGMRMGGGRGMGGGMGGHHRGMKDDSSDSAKRPEAGFEQRLDQNDAEAYLDAESVLTDAQRAQAREIAEHYREQLFEWREARRASAKSGDRPSPRSSPTPP